MIGHHMQQRKERKEREKQICKQQEELRKPFRSEKQTMIRKKNFYLLQ